MTDSHSLKSTHPTLLTKPIIFAFLLSLIYWAYLFFSSQMQISADAIGYERLGSLLYHQGLTEYLKQGPTREPLYPWTISVSMSLGDFFHLSYQTFQKSFQLIILLLTQILVLKTLERMKASVTACFVAVLYCGLSPVMVNAALSLYSEILTFPLLAGIILTTSLLWEKLHSDRTVKIVLFSVLLSLLLTLMTSVKAIFEYIGLLFLLPFVFLFCYAAFKKNWKLLVNTLLALIFVAGIHQGAAAFYKHLNQKYNGHYAFTDRGSWLLYGSTARRLQPLNRHKIMTLVSTIPGEGVCQSFFDPQDCEYWHFKTSDGLGWKKVNELKGMGTPEEKIDSALIDAAKSEALKNPLQYCFLMGLESFRMFFFESTQIGFVAYPNWLARTFEFTLFKNGLRLIMSLLTFFSLFYLITFLWQRRKDMLTTPQNDFETTFIFFLLVMIFSYIVMHSLVSIVVRFAIPLSVLYLICIAYTLESLQRKCQNHH